MNEVEFGSKQNKQDFSCGRPKMDNEKRKIFQKKNNHFWDKRVFIYPIIASHRITLSCSDLSNQ